MHNMRMGDPPGNPTGQTPQKPVNLLPDIPVTTSRKLTEREQRDCEVIGELSPSDICLPTVFSI